MNKILTFILSILFSTNIFAQYSAGIRGMWVEHNVNNGMRIHVKFTTYGMKKEYGYCYAYFFNMNGYPAKSTDGKYEAADGQICVSKRFMPGYEDTIFKDFQLWIPYQQIFDRRGSRKMQFLIQIKDPYGYTIATSKLQKFEISNW